MIVFYITVSNLGTTIPEISPSWQELEKWSFYEASQEEIGRVKEEAETILGRTLEFAKVAPCLYTMAKLPPDCPQDQVRIPIISRLDALGCDNVTLITAGSGNAAKMAIEFGFIARCLAMDLPHPYSGENALKDFSVTRYFPTAAQRLTRSSVWNIPTTDEENVEADSKEASSPKHNL